MNIEKFETTCIDGTKLRGKLIIANNPKAVIQFNCGTGTPKEFYLPFLHYFAENGYTCCLWDYRGSGESSPELLKRGNIRFADYGLKDMPAIKTFLREKYPELPFLIFGHSAGGQQIGWMEDLTDVKGIINFAVSSGYYPNMPFSYRMKAYIFFYLFSPLSNLIFGYVKAKSLNFMENLPKRVVTEWRDWLEKEHYFFDPKFYGKTVPEGHYKSFQLPIHTYWTTDDTISNEKNTKLFWSTIQSEQPVTFTKLEPSQFELKKIDHFGFFKRNMKDKLWPEILKRADALIDTNQEF